MACIVLLVQGADDYCADQNVCAPNCTGQPASYCSPYRDATCAASKDADGSTVETCEPQAVGMTCAAG
jgi:hypothetical protein